MKIICVSPNKTNHIPNLLIKPDTAVHNTEQPLYLPDFSEDIRYKVGIVVKIDKQGKCIAQKFAHKYYEQMSLGIDMLAYDLYEQLKANQQSCQVAQSFDSSIIIGKFLSKETCTTDDIYFLKNEQKIQTENIENLLETINQSIACISNFFTLRKGDVVFIEKSQNWESIKNIAILQGFVQNNRVFSTEILK